LSLITALDLAESKKPSKLMCNNLLSDGILKTAETFIDVNGNITSYKRPLSRYEAGLPNRPHNPYHIPKFEHQSINQKKHPICKLGSRPINFIDYGDHKPSKMAGKA
jgi:hypothetical protein